MASHAAQQHPSEIHTNRPGVFAPCRRCERDVGLCMCDQIVPVASRLPVLVLQHPHEHDRELGTVPLLTRALTTAHLVVGLSWRSLHHASASAGIDLHAEVSSRRWAVVYPSALPRDLTAAESQDPFVLMDARGGSAKLKDVEGLVVLDGTWRGAKALWWRNAWLLKLQRIIVHPPESSIYGRLRREPRRHCVSTLEAVADAMVALGEPEQTRANMRRAFRTMVQRARDQRAKPGAKSPACDSRP